MPNLLEDRDKRTIYRKLAKEQFDNIIDLSVRDGTKVRLLDEGAVVDAFGDIDCYIEKGTLGKFLKELPGDYEGTINLGHIPFAVFPFILGKWKKTDFEIVDIGNGRQALDIALHLDRESSIIKELKRQPYDVGVSAEFTYHGDYKELEVEPGVKRYVLCIDELFISDFAIVGECGNVNSSGINMNIKKGGIELKLKDLFKPKEEKELAVDVTTEEVVEEATEEVTEETTEEAVEETSEEAVEEKQPDISEMAEAIMSLKDEVEKITSDRDALVEENKALKAELSDIKEDIKDFTANFREMTVKLNPNISKPKEKKELKPTRSSDGIGEL